MSIGEIIFAVLVTFQATFVIASIGMLIAALIKDEIKKSEKLIIISAIFLAISPLFSMVGVFFGFFFK